MKKIKNNIIIESKLIVSGLDYYDDDSTVNVSIGGIELKQNTVSPTTFYDNSFIVLKNKSTKTNSIGLLPTEDTVATISSSNPYTGLGIGVGGGLNILGSTLSYDKSVFNFIGITRNNASTTGNEAGAFAFTTFTDDNSGNIGIDIVRPIMTLTAGDAKSHAFKGFGVYDSLSPITDSFGKIWFSIDNGRLIGKQSDGKKSPLIIDGRGVSSTNVSTSYGSTGIILEFQSNEVLASSITADGGYHVMNSGMLTLGCTIDANNILSGYSDLGSGGGVYISSDTSETGMIVLADPNFTNGFTDIANVNTFGKIKRYSSGLSIEGFAQSGGLASAVDITGYATSPQLGTFGVSNLADGVVNIRALRRVGTTYSSLSSTHIAFTIKTSSDFTSGSKLMMLGDGTLLIDVSAPTIGTGNVNLRYYDDYDDITLVDTARKIMGGWENKVLKENKELLSELGIINNGMMDVQKMQALHLGAMGQVWNVLRAVGEKLGLDSSELLKLSKQY